MQTLICKNCGSTSFTEISDGYVCQHCGTKIVKKIRYSQQKRLKLIIGILVLLLVVGIMIYIGVVGVSKKIDKITSVEHKNIDKSNHLQDIDQKIKRQIAKKINLHPLEKILDVYNNGSPEKAFYISLDQDGKYAYGYSLNNGTIKEANKKAFKKCEKERKKKSLKDICFPYLINDRMSSEIVEDTL